MSPDKTPLREELFDCPRLRCGETKSRLWDRAENAEAEVVRLRQRNEELSNALVAIDDVIFDALKQGEMGG